MKFAKTWVLGLSVMLMMTAAAPLAFAQAAQVRWDIVSIDFAAGTISAGGFASASANDPSLIKVTGSGTFVATAGGDVTGGGDWQTFDDTGTSTGTGTYVVTDLVRWEPAPGGPAGLIDLIGDPSEQSAGLAVLNVEFSDGSHGVLIVDCNLPGTPVSHFEGITMSKDSLDYWNRNAPVPGVDANRTLFHVHVE